MSDEYIRFPDVRRIAGGLARSTIWRAENEGNFPKRRRISAGAVGWLRSEVEAWAASCKLAETVQVAMPRRKSKGEK